MDMEFIYQIDKTNKESDLHLIYEKINKSNLEENRKKVLKDIINLKIELINNKNYYILAKL